MFFQVRELDVCMLRIERACRNAGSMLACVTECPVSQIDHRPDMLNKCHHYSFCGTISKRKR